MTVTFDGKTAMVTGGGSGIGKALCLELARRKAKVLVTDIDEAAARAVAEGLGNGSRAVRLDVRDAAAFQGAMDEFADENGGLDLLFNNAGIAIGGELHELTLAHWDRIIDINLRGVVHGVAAAYPRMVRQERGHIVNVASLAGLGPAPLLVPYAATKHAVVGLSMSLRIEAAALGIRVSALCPAAIETPILESDNPADLPGTTWRPNMRRFLTRLGGPPYPVDKMATEALDAVADNVAVIVLPGAARMAWRLGRMLPSLVESLAGKAVAAERADKVSLVKTSRS
ncbi:MAG: SDR family oxidoreductase [Deltaproteobacteria bacterium]|nr:SDR family oxidoreductase [Deltaproteobacteria bacterium]